MPRKPEQHWHCAFCPPPGPFPPRAPEDKSVESIVSDETNNQSLQSIDYLNAAGVLHQVEKVTIEKACNGKPFDGSHLHHPARVNPKACTAIDNLVNFDDDLLYSANTDYFDCAEESYDCSSSTCPNKEDYLDKKYRLRSLTT